MFLIFFIIFLVTPILEIVLFIQIGGIIGVVPTILIVIITAILGSILLRLQGGAVIRRTQMALRAGELPVDPVIDGISLLMAGALLLTPGFFTDAVGFLLFIPPFRRTMARWIFQQMVRSGNVFVVGGDAGNGGEPRGGRRGPDEPRDRRRRDETIIDVEYEPVDEESRDHGPAHDQDDEREDQPGPRRGSSPWRQ